MTFDISGKVIRWPDGSDGTIRQESFDQDKTSTSGRHAYIARLRIDRADAPDITGGLRFTAKAHERMPGRNDEEKANAVALKIVSWVALHGLKDGFFFRVDVDEDNFGIELFEA